MTGSAALFWSVTTPVASPAPRSIRVGATLSEAAKPDIGRIAIKRAARVSRGMVGAAQKVSVMLTVSV